MVSPWWVPHEVQTSSRKPKMVAFWFCFRGGYVCKILVPSATPGSSEGTVWKLRPLWDAMLLPWEHDLWLGFM